MLIPRTSVGTVPALLLIRSDVFAYQSPTAQQHLVVDKHELEMEAIRIVRVELQCRVENWFVWIL